MITPLTYNRGESSVQLVWNWNVTHHRTASAIEISTDRVKSDPIRLIHLWVNFLTSKNVWFESGWFEILMDIHVL